MSGRPFRNVSLGGLRFGELERRYIGEVLESNRLSYGRFSRLFEQRFAALHEVRHTVLMNSGTSALHVGLAALKERGGWRDGDEVIVPAVTFIASSNMVLLNGLKPVFADVEPHTYNLDPAAVEVQITPRTRAIMPVHLCGLPCDMQPLVDIARRHDLRIIEDSCETMFARYRGRPVGGWGDVAAFSTYVAHLIVTGVGGMVTTNDDDLAVICRSLMAHGRDSIYLSIDDDDTKDEARLKKIIERRFSFVRMGYSYRVTEFEAALGVAQLEHYDSMFAQRQDNVARLTKGLQRFDTFLQLPVVPADREHAFMIYPISTRGGCSRDALVNHLERHGVETRYLFPLLTQPIYQELFGINHLDKFPVAKGVHQNAFYIGCHQELGADDVAHVIDVVDDFFNGRR